MILATDVYYGAAGGAHVAGVLFESWTDETASNTCVVPVNEVAPYRPGRFFERELPCLLALLDALPDRPDMIVVDGHAVLDAQGTPGLGAHLFTALGNSVPVIGVAKSRFQTTPDAAAVLRGGSSVPLYVTACGLGPEAAREYVATMHGEHRMPTLLRLADRLCRDAALAHAGASGKPQTC